MAALGVGIAAIGGCGGSPTRPSSQASTTPVSADRDYAACLGLAHPLNVLATVLADVGSGHTTAGAAADSLGQAADELTQAGQGASARVQTTFAALVSDIGQLRLALLANAVAPAQFDAVTRASEDATAACKV